MHKQQQLLITTLALVLMVGLFLSPSPASAFTKVTRTPLAEDETDIETLLERVITHLEAEDYRDAIDVLNNIIAIDETLWDAYFFRAFAFAQIGDTDRAIDDYTRAISIRPYDWTTYTLRGNMYIQTGDLEQANFDYDQAIYLNPRYADAYVGKAILNSQQSDQTLTEIFQGIFEALQARAAGDANANIDILTAAIDAVDTDSIPSELGYVYYNRANTYIGLANWESALDDMNTAIELQPHMQDYYMARGFIYSETDQLAQAGPDFYERMTLVELNSVEGELELGSTASIEMDYGTVHRMTFDGELGQRVTITARDGLGVGVDPLLVLLDTDGNPIAGNDDGGGELDSLLRDYELPANGTFTAVISHANGGFVGTVNVSLK